MMSFLKVILLPVSCNACGFLVGALVFYYNRQIADYMYPAIQYDLGCVIVLGVSVFIICMSFLLCTFWTVKRKKCEKKCYTK